MMKFVLVFSALVGAQTAWADACGAVSCNTYSNRGMSGDPMQLAQAGTTPMPPPLNAPNQGFQPGAFGPMNNSGIPRPNQGMPPVGVGNIGTPGFNTGVNNGFQPGAFGPATNYGNRVIATPQYGNGIPGQYNPQFNNSHLYPTPNYPIQYQGGVYSNGAIYPNGPMVGGACGIPGGCGCGLPGGCGIVRPMVGFSMFVRFPIVRPRVFACGGGCGCVRARVRVRYFARACGGGCC